MDEWNIPLLKLEICGCYVSWKTLLVSRKCTVGLEYFNDIDPRNWLEFFWLHLSEILRITFICDGVLGLYPDAKFSVLSFWLDNLKGRDINWSHLIFWCQWLDSGVRVLGVLWNSFPYTFWLLVGFGFEADLNILEIGYQKIPWKHVAFQ